MRAIRREPTVRWRVEKRREQAARDALQSPPHFGQGGPEKDPADEEAAEVGTVTLLKGGVMTQLNLLAGEIWKLADGTLDREGLVAGLLEAFEADPVELSRDVDEFLDDLIAKGLLHEDK